MTTTTAAPSSPDAGRLVTLGRYDTDRGARLVCGQRVTVDVEVEVDEGGDEKPLTAVKLSDRPASGRGRSYTIEEGLRSNAELQALVADYLAKAERLGRIAALYNPLG